MGKYKVMKPAKEVDVSAVKYKEEAVKAPHLTGFMFKLFVNILETPLIGSSILDSSLKKSNGMTEMFRNTVIPEEPMFRPEFPPHSIFLFLCSLTIVCVGYDKERLPIGLQIMGRPWAEATVLALAAAVEELAPVTKKPAVFHNVLNTNRVHTDLSQR